MNNKNLEKSIVDLNHIIQLLRRDIDKFRTDFFEIRIKIEKIEKKQNEKNN